ncbi:hypothetical protein [Nannocystis punicea]|uniref:TniQ protein n=1 Tax=Nannocystis punicea TaxID=2995304 RepID=A0ABY7H5G1_9BACT|nr:hypothetical protein [Nannocystis poenicansa]WAS94398.1 hypothetical protein O0S08_50410 [Nannocystis poenicansa]
MTLNDPPVDFPRVLAVLQGAPPGPRPKGVAEMLRVLFTSETDTEISPRGFVVHFSSGRAIPYPSEPMAAALAALLTRAQICPQGQPMSFRLVEEDAYALSGFLDAARWVWIFPGDDLVLVAMRKPTSPGPPPAVPSPLPSPVRSKKLYAHLVQPLACPHCERLSKVYRATLDAWICGGPHCGQSFSPPHRVRALAELRDDAGEVVRETTARAKIYR